MRTLIANRSAAQGFARSRLPSFTDEEKASLKGAYDYFAINNYGASLAKAPQNRSLADISYLADQEVESYKSPSWPRTAVSNVKNPQFIFTHRSVCILTF